MKNCNILFVICIILGSVNLCSQTLISWNFPGQPGNQTSQNSNSSVTGIGTGNLTRGIGINAETTMNAMNSSGWLESSGDIDDINEQISENDYYEFTLPILSNYQAIITSITVSTTASGTGPDGTEIRWGVDNFSTTFSPNMAAQTGTIVFRLYGTRSMAGGSALGTLRITSLSINGTVSLPVTFNNFTIYKKHLSTIIIFSTASETNNDYFTIERSADGRDFNPIGMIDGAGNSNTEISYEFTDKKPLTGINYYRIKQTDYDSQYSFTDIRSVRFSGVGGIQVSPRTTDGRLTINTNMEDYSVTMVNAAGQTIKIWTNLSLDQTIDVEDLLTGLYFVRVSSGSDVETIKVIKI